MFLFYKQTHRYTCSFCCVRSHHLYLFNVSFTTANIRHYCHCRIFSFFFPYIHLCVCQWIESSRMMNKKKIYKKIWIFFKIIISINCKDDERERGFLRNSICLFLFFFCTHIRETISKRKEQTNLKWYLFFLQSHINH